MTIIRPQLDQIRIPPGGELPFTLIDAVRKIYDYLTQIFNLLEGVGLSGITVIQNTHANRLILFTPSKYGLGSLYFETDRTVLYVDRTVSSAKAWVYAGGVMSGLVAARPADLGLNDAGFLFTSTDSLDYRWSGTAWVTLGTVKGGASLTNVGRLTKVTAAGTIGESAVQDDGSANVYTIARNFIVGAAAAFSTAAGRVYSGVKGVTDAGVFEATSAVTDADATSIGEFQVSDSHGTNAEKRLAIIQVVTDGTTATKRGGRIYIGTKVDNGVFTFWITLNQTGKCGFGGNVAPAYPVDATGDINASGVFRQAGTAGISGTAALAPLTALGTPGSLTYSGGIITAYIAPT